MKPFTFTVPEQVHFGLGVIQDLPALLKKLNGDRVILVSDRGLEAIGLVAKVRTILQDAGLGYAEYLDVVPNPTAKNVNDCVKIYKESGANAILALGGGSAMDTAKAAGILRKYGGEIGQYEGGDTVPGPIDPLIAIATTAGTGSEVSTFSVIVDEVRNYKLTINDLKLAPTIALLDPELIMTAPPSIAAACGMDAFIHAMESYINNAENVFAEALAEKAMELIGGHIRRFVAVRTDEEAACAMMLGSTFAGITMMTRLGEVHAMSHPVSAYFGVAHGVANAILLPTVTEFNALGDKNGKYAKIYQYVTGSPAPAGFKPIHLAQVLRELNDELGIPACLAEVGVTEDKIPVMAADAMKSGNILVNPRTATQADIEALYHKAMYTAE